MKNQKFFFNVVAVLFVVGVFVLFVVGFKSLVFTKVGTVRLVQTHQVAVVEQAALSNVIVGDVIGNSIKAEQIALNDMSSITAPVPVRSAVDVLENVRIVNSLKNPVIRVDNHCVSELI
ncbi:MAG TPA: hypothetical protein VI306_19920 [Pyrinomonadaceae bacterium]